MKKIFLVYVDALSSKYINRCKIFTVFNMEKSSEKSIYEEVKPSFGFCERAEVFTGVDNYTNGFFTALDFNSSYTNHDNIFHGLVSKLEMKVLWLNYFLVKYKVCGWSLHRYYRKILGLLKFVPRTSVKPYLIPLSFLKFFKYSEDSTELDEIVVESRSSLFDVLGNNNDAYTLEFFTSLKSSNRISDEERYYSALDIFVKDDKIKFLPVYISEIDQVGHDFGPDSVEMDVVLEKWDRILQDTLNKYFFDSKESILVVLGDHGMAKVSHSVDILAELFEFSKIFNLPFGERFFFFLDSTICRVWLSDESIRTSFSTFIESKSYLTVTGSFFKSSEFSSLNIFNENRSNGDFIWVANSGTVIYPDFFRNNSIVNGMHGYRETSKDLLGSMFVFGGERSVSSKRINLTDVRDILIAELYD